MRFAFFVQKIDKNTQGTPLEESGIQVRWEETDGSLFNVSVGVLSPQEPGESIVTVDGTITNDLTVTFTGGKIRLRDWTGKNPEYFNLTCDIHPDDVITMVLTAVS